MRTKKKCGLDPEVIFRERKAEILQEMAGELLDLEEQREFEEMLESGLDKGQEYLFAIVDIHYHLGNIVFNKAEKLFRRIGIPPARAADLRQEAELEQVWIVSH